MTQENERTKEKRREDGDNSKYAPDINASPTRSTTSMSLYVLRHRAVPNLCNSTAVTAAASMVDQMHIKYVYSCVCTRAANKSGNARDLLEPRARRVLLYLKQNSSKF